MMKDSWWNGFIVGAASTAVGLAAGGYISWLHAVSLVGIMFVYRFICAQFGKF